MAEPCKLAVLGAGVMGAGIAAQAANAGCSVLLLDMSRELAAAALERLARQKPAAFMEPQAARRIATGSIAEDLPRIAACDWIIEAVVERADVKRDLYREMARYRAPEAAVSSNTSTIPLGDLMRDAPEGFRRHFLITHFFNPPRYMRLLEIVAGPETDPAVVERVSHLADVAMGKTIVRCKDRPGFVANRLGCFWMQCAIAEAIAMGLDAEEADAVMGKPFGIPKTGVFGLADLVGIDLMPKVNASLAATLEAGDAFHAVNTPVPLIDWMIGEGLTGRKGKGGFYRLNRKEGGKETLDLASRGYRPLRPVKVGDAATLLMDQGRLGRYARSVMLKTLAYAANLLGDAADDVQSIDTAMRLGYNWALGPFQLIDRIGGETVRTLMNATGIVPPAVITDAPFYRDGEMRDRAGAYRPLTRPVGVLVLDDVKRRPAVMKTQSAALWDLGGGVACFELATKMNTLDAAAFSALDDALRHVVAGFRAMVIYSDAPHFSAGVNLNWVMSPGADVEQLARTGQQALKRLKYAGTPTVAAVAGLAIGGGCELALHCAGIQAHAETYIGLVEAGVGILPAWGGCGELLSRLFADPAMPKGPMPAVSRAFELIATAKVSGSAMEARQLGFLRAGDGITMNRDRLLAEAKAKAIALAVSYQPPPPPAYILPGPTGFVALKLAGEAQAKLGLATAHDLRVAAAIATVLTGGDADITVPCTEEHLLALEREQVQRLAVMPDTAARIRHMLETGKPLRN